MDHIKRDTKQTTVFTLGQANVLSHAVQRIAESSPRMILNFVQSLGIYVSNLSINVIHRAAFRRLSKKK